MLSTDWDPYRIGMLVAFVLAAGCSCTATDRDAAAPVRNVVFIIGDDHAPYVLGAYGNGLVRTPNLDRLAAEGVRFDRAYVNAPVCTPSRQSILTAKLPHATAVNYNLTPLSKHEVTIADHLKQFEFRTGAIGKMEFNGDRAFLRSQGYDEAVVQTASTHHGFDVRVDRGDHRRQLRRAAPRMRPDSVTVRPPWRPSLDPARIWLNADVYPGGLYDEDAQGTYFARKAVDFLKANRDQRFCLWLSFREPHAPFNFPIDYSGRIDPDRMPLPQASAEDEPGVPLVFRDLSDEDKRGITAAYYTSVEYLDKNVGLVLDALEQLDLADDTLVVYVGDHGYLLGHHGRFEKHTMWEEAVRAPLLLRNIRRLGRARSTDALVEFIDLAPTILELLGVPPMASAQGRSLVPLLDGMEDRHRDYVFSELLIDNKAMVRSERWKYIFATGARPLAKGLSTGLAPPGIHHRLYDLDADPRETTNLADDPAYATVLSELKQTMLGRFEASHPNADAIPPDLSLDETLAWFCEPTDPRPSAEPK